MLLQRESERLSFEAHQNCTVREHDNRRSTPLVSIVSRQLKTMINGGEKAVSLMAKCASTNSSGREGWGPRKAHFEGEWRWGKTMCTEMVILSLVNHQLGRLCYKYSHG